MNEKEKQPFTLNAKDEKLFNYSEYFVFRGVDLEPVKVKDYLPDMDSETARSLLMKGLIWPDKSEAEVIRTKILKATAVIEGWEYPLRKNEEDYLNKHFPRMINSVIFGLPVFQQRWLIVGLHLFNTAKKWLYALFAVLGLVAVSNPSTV